eukprot:TRINITY_DN1901_c0_g1_i1.p1 TRINITY_DN1901_c0_g1~~TRINITY_DN1901_c0_g1_i1.p1  ORF type:complete len:216 (-),score=52.44 TRINITY_DN1901_c0_g1_i1:19-666(-)
MSDEWAIERDRKLQAEKGLTDENNDILLAMRAANLRHVEYGIGGPAPETEDKEAELNASEQASRARSEENRDNKHQSPDLMRTALKYNVGRVEDQRRLWIDFFEQWTDVELLALVCRIIERTGGASAAFGSDKVQQVIDKKLAELSLDSVAAAATQAGEKHTFNTHTREWLDLLDSNHVSYSKLLSRLEGGDQTDEKDSGWYALVVEFLKKQKKL